MNKMIKKDYPIYGDIFQLLKKIFFSFIIASIPQTIFLIIYAKDAILAGVIPNIGLINLIMLFMTFFEILAILYFARKEKRTYVSLGLNTKSLIPHYLLGLLIGICMLSCTLLITYLLNGVSFVKFNGFKPILLLYFLGFMIQGFSEELICRGYLMNGLLKGGSVLFCIMINSAIFSLLHILNTGINLLSLINIFLIGIVFSLLTILVDNIWISSGMHTMWNFALGNIFGIFVSGLNMEDSLMNFALHGNTLISGGLFGLEGTIACTIVSIVAICILYKKSKSKITIYYED